MVTTGGEVEAMVVAEVAIMVQSECLSATQPGDTNAHPPLSDRQFQRLRDGCVQSLVILC